MPLTEHIAPSIWFSSDKQFNNLYPQPIQALADRHWTPLAVAMKAARFLAGDGQVNVLDIGSGVGKFCLAAAWYTPYAHYYGVEQRESLVRHAKNAKGRLQMGNVSFIHGNFSQLDLKNYDHFYFYNAFYENLNGTDKIDDTIDYSSELYDYYSWYLYRQLQQKPAGTRLCTLCSAENEIPPDFQVVHADLDDLFKCWVKI